MTPRRVSLHSTTARDRILRIQEQMIQLTLQAPRPVGATVYRIRQRRAALAINEAANALLSLWEAL